MLGLVLIAAGAPCGDSSSTTSDDFDDDDVDDDLADDDLADDDSVDDDSTDDDVDDDVAPPFDPAAFVDPFIGTMLDHGQLSPAAAAPFGMVKLGPDTLIRAHAGYEFSLPAVLGFSHTRIDGVGCSGAGGQLRVLPGAGRRTVIAQPLKKKSEIAQAGYYAANVGNDGEIRVELTVAEHTGLHRYTFSGDESPYLLLNFNDPFTESLGSEWAANQAQDEINGWVAGTNVCGRGRYQFFFSMKFSRPFTRLRSLPGAAGGTNARVDFAALRGEPLLVKVGLSSVGAEEARQDREIEAPGWDFDALRAQAWQAWREQL
ncbi:MAG: hypothetical protein ACTSXZ_02070, partial [Alphaproteobacteria bacterium]